ncbi:MAG: DUF5677 domain-containing protein, partial [Candidatus Acidiferrales bacterium]
MSFAARQEEHGTFGFEEFWPVAYKQYRHQFDTISELVALANEMLEAAKKTAVEPIEKIVCELTRSTTAAANEVVLLCGNGCGVGALKIVRGMFESSWMAEYLRRNPKEADDYLDFLPISIWRRFQWLLATNPDKAKLVAQETVRNNEDEYNRVKPRFSDASGHVRNQWSQKSIKKVAEEI